MADPSAAVQAAFVARYRGDTALQGILSGYNAAIGTPEWNIFDQGGSGQIVPVFPYIYLHPIMNVPGTALAMNKDAVDVLMQVSIFTNTEGFDQARAIAFRLYALTNGRAGAAGFSLSGGFTNIWTSWEQRNELEQTTDMLVQHLMDRYKVWTQ
jgi:Protein of unknown function (DUF3168)